MKSIKDLHKEYGIPEDGSGQKIRSMLVKGKFGSDWTTVAGKRHKYEVGPDAEARIVEAWRKGMIR